MAPQQGRVLNEVGPGTGVYRASACRIAGVTRNSPCRLGHCAKIRRKPTLTAMWAAARSMAEPANRTRATPQKLGGSWATAPNLASLAQAHDLPEKSGQKTKTVAGLNLGAGEALRRATKGTRKQVAGRPIRPAGRRLGLPEAPRTGTAGFRKARRRYVARISSENGTGSSGTFPRRSGTPGALLEGEGGPLSPRTQAAAGARPGADPSAI